MMPCFYGVLAVGIGALVYGFYLLTKKENMEKHICFRLIELPFYQVLLMKDFDAEELDEEGNNVPKLLIIFFVEPDVKLSIGLGFQTEEERDAAFRDFTTERAQSLVEAQVAAFTGG